MKATITGVFRFSRIGAAIRRARFDRARHVGNVPHARSGVSLLEVLISIFVLTIGLLAVAAVIPVGRHAIREAAKGTEVYPWANATEYEFSPGDHLKD